MSDEPKSNHEIEAAQRGEASGKRVDRIQAVTHSVEYVYSGPLPPPEVLKRFEEVLPGSAERIFAQFESQSQHRQKLEAKVVSAGVISQYIGSVSGTLIGLLGVGGGIWLTHEGKSLEGLTALVTTLAALIGTYLYKRTQQDDERSEKSNLK